MVEEKLTNLYRQGKVVGGLYRSLGQEACSVGSAYALERGDIFTPLIRNLGAIFVRGGQPRDVFAQYMATARRAHPRPRPQHPLRLALRGGQHARRHLDARATWSRSWPGAVIAERMKGKTHGGPHLDRRRRHLDRRLPRGVQPRLRAEGSRSSLIVENNKWAYSTPTAQADGQHALRGPGARPTAAPARRWTATTCWRSTR